MIELDKKKILEIQKNRPPYLMIDHATKVLPGKSASGYKDLQLDEWFFKVHWEGDPNMPGMLQIESLVQMSSLSILCLPGNAGKFMYLIAATNLKFIKKIIPGQRLYIDTHVNSFKRGFAICIGIGIVDNEIVCKADFSLVLPDEIKKYNLK